jgi:hypothetical protein
MPETTQTNPVAVIVPTAAPGVENHNNKANVAIEAMSVWRQRDAETTLRSWRRVVESIDPVRENGWAFSGPELEAGAEVSLPVGTIIVVCDQSWAKARWYAGQHMKRMEIEAGIYEVTPHGLTALTRSTRRQWAQDLVSWLIANRPNISKRARVVFSKGTV